MPVESDSDRAVFLSANEFGDNAIYTKAGGAPASLTGVFDAPHIDVAMWDAPSSERRPTFLCRTSDIPAGAAGGGAGDALLVDGTAYNVVDLEPDGQGMTRVVLGAIS